MAKHRIAWLPGDGIGKDVLDATKIVLDGIGFDAEYMYMVTSDGNSGVRKVSRYLRERSIC